MPSPGFTVDTTRTGGPAVRLGPLAAPDTTPLFPHDSCLIITTGVALRRATG
ncbi:hypothetical protein ACWD6I_07460 [Streptomyces sp. NPDC002454]